LDKTVQRVVSFFVEYGGAKEKDRDLYQYGATIFLSTMVNLVITVVVGFAVGMPLLLLTYFIPFLLIRGFAGGYHAKTFWGCVATSTGVMISVVFLLRFVSVSLYLPLAGLFIIASGIIIIKLAPVVSSNRRIEVAEHGMMRKYAFGVLGVAILVCIKLLIIGTTQYIFSISLGIGIASMTLLFCKKVKP